MAHYSSASRKTTAHRQGREPHPHSEVIFESKNDKATVRFQVPYAEGYSVLVVEIDPQDFAAFIDCMICANKGAALSAMANRVARELSKADADSDSN